MFQYRLASHLGYTRADMLRSMDTQELKEWAAYQRIEPFLRDVLPHELAALRLVTASPWSKRKLSLSDMMIEWGNAQHKMKPQTTEQMRAALSGLMSAAQGSKHGAQD